MESEMNETGDWLSRLGEPFFRSREEAEAFVAHQLPAVVLEGWTVERPSDPALTWVVKRTNPPPEQWRNQEYSVQITDGLDFLIFTHGNTDIGPFGLHHALRNALVIEAVMLRRFSLTECLDFLYRKCKPNEWGYT